jgi:hypothetical protein
MARNEEFEHGRDHQARAEMGAELFKEALLKQRGLGPDISHDHDYSDSKNNDTCSTCGATNPNDSYDKGKD